MVASVVKWEALVTDRGDIITTAFNDLANNDLAASSEIDNGTNLDTYGWIEINVTFGSSPNDTNPSIDIYLSIALDNTNYSTAPVTSGTNQDLFVCSIPVQKNTSAQRLISPRPILLPACKFKLYADNQTGVAFPSSGSTLALYTANLESQ